MIALVGFNANAAMYIVGNNPFGDWHTYKGAEMTEESDGVYTYVTDQIGSTVWFVFADGLTTGTDDDWNTFNSNYRYGPLTSGESIDPNVEYTTQKSTNGDASYSFTGAAGQSYKFTFNTNTMKFKVEGYVPPIVINTYSVAGSPASIFGAEWSDTNTATDMTLVDGLYTWIKEGVELTAGTTIAFKIVGNHDWGFAWPTDNVVFSIEETGIYDLVFTIDPETKVVGYAANKVQDGPEVNPLTGHLYIVGQVNNNGWNPSTAVEMTAGENNVFTLTDAVISDAEEGYGFFSFMSKLGENANDWPNDYRIGATEDGYVVTAGVAAPLGEWVVSSNNAFKALAGYYDITVDLTAGTVLLVAKEAPQPTVDPVYIMGNVNGLTWDAIHGVEMTYDETTKVYTAEINVTDANNGKGYFGFTKQLADTTLETDVWDQIVDYRFGPVCDPEAENWVMTENLLGTDCALDMQSSKSIEIPAGTWTVTVDLNTNVFKINGEWPTDTVVPEPYTGEVYILGDVNDNGGWFTNKGVKMTRDAENNVYTATITTTGEAYVDPETNIGYSYFSFTKQLADSATDWEAIAPYRFGAVSEGDFLVTEEQLNKELSLEMNRVPHAFKITAGQWNLTLSVDDMTLVITKAAGKRGDVNGDGNVDITDATTLINFLLYGDATGIVQENANCDLQNNIDISDATTLINFLLYGSWGE